MRILVAEDDDMIAKALSAALTAEGFTVDLVKDGETAWMLSRLAAMAWYCSTSDCRNSTEQRCWNAPAVPGHPYRS